MTDLNEVGPYGHSQQGPTVPRAIRDKADRTEDGFTFLRGDGSEKLYTFADIASEMNRRGRALLAQGLRKGDRLGMIVPEGEDFILSFFGALAVGVVPVPMYPPLSFGKLDSYISAAAGILAAAGARMVLTDRKVQTVLWSLVDRVPSLEGVITADVLAAEPDTSPVDIDHIQPDDLAFLQFTSGSTATPKGVMVTHRTLIANLYGIMVHFLKVQPGDRAVSWLPLYHDMGLIGFTLAPAWYGTPTVFIPTLQFVRHPNLWMDTMAKYHGNMSFAPNFAYALAARRTPPSKVAELDLSHIKALGCGAEPNNPVTLRTFVDHFAPAGLRPEAILPSYGMAEATLAISMCDLDDPLKTDIIEAEAYHDHAEANPAAGEGAANGGSPSGRLEFVSCGHVMPGHEVVIVDESGRALPERSVGEILLRGPSVTAGYFERPDATADTYAQAGLHTGDLGYKVGDELYVTGRKKDLIILNGRNYDPQSIEWAVAEVSGIRKGNVVAFSRPGDSTEGVVIVAETRRTSDAAELKNSVTKHVAESLFLKVSDVVLVGPGQLPKTSSGKLQRAKTRQQYLSGVLGREGVRTLGSRGQTFVVAKHVAQSMVSRVRHSVRRRAHLLMARRLGQDESS